MPAGLTSARAGATLWRAIAALAVMLALAPLAQRPLLQAMAPAWASVAQAADADFRVEHVGLAHNASGSQLQLRYVTARFVIVGAHVLDPAAGHRGSAALPQGVPWQWLTLLVVALAAWPCTGGAREWVLRPVVAAPLAWGLLALLLPLELGGQMRAALYDAAQLQAGDWLTAVSRWLAAGGRSGLALAAGVSSALAAGVVARRWCARAAA